MQEVRVVSSNDLGDDAIKTASFNPDVESELIVLFHFRFTLTYTSLSMYSDNVHEWKLVDAVGEEVVVVLLLLIL